jgi:CheY-like chemotaxis protein
MQVLGTNGASPHKILLVDDNRMGLVARKTVLAENGYDVTTVDKPERVLALMQEQRYSLVVTDYKMPKQTGVELIGCVREAGHRQPIILMSGYVEALGLTEANTGADMVIQKGALEVPQLLHAVRSLLNMRKPPASDRPQPTRRRRKA